MKKYRNFIAPALFVITLGISNFTGLASATVQTSTITPYNSISAKDPTRVEFITSIVQFVQRLAPQVVKQVPGQLPNNITQLLVGAGNNLSGTEILNEKSLD
jgi:hypothetical protein